MSWHEKEIIRAAKHFGDALRYLIGEKLFSFVHASEEDPDFAAELPAIVAEIRRIFTAEEILAPTTNSFIRHDDAPLNQEIFDIAKAHTDNDGKAKPHG